MTNETVSELLIRKQRWKNHQFFYFFFYRARKTIAESKPSKVSIGFPKFYSCRKKELGWSV